MHTPGDTHPHPFSDSGPRFAEGRSNVCGGAGGDSGIGGFGGIGGNAILDAWEKTLTGRGGEAAILSGQGETLRTFEGIEREAREWAVRLAREGALPRAFLPRTEAAESARPVVALQIGNRPEWPALILACLRLGAVPLPLGRHIETAERALALETCSVSAWVGESDEGAGLAVHAVGARVKTPPCWPAPPPDFLKLTSGTGSAPRAIRFRAEQLLEDCLQICETMGIGEGDLNYAVIPLSHSYGFSNLVTPLLCLGVPMALSEDRMPRAILEGLARTGATVFPGMPVFFDKLGSLEAPPPLPRLRLCISAGAPLTPEIARRFTARFGLKIHTFYGSSECGGIAYDATEERDYPEAFVGRPMSRVAIEPRAGGTIEVKGAAVGDGYWPLPGGLPQDDPVFGRGHFVPGDLVRFEPRGLFLAGRVSDIINVAGRKLNPREVEAQLLRLAGVREAVVFGVPSALRHEEAVACVVLEGGVTAQDLLHFARTTLSGWQVPKDIWIVAGIPVNERGKISRRELAKRYAEGHR